MASSALQPPPPNDMARLPEVYASCTVGTAGAIALGCKGPRTPSWSLIAEGALGWLLPLPSLLPLMLGHVCASSSPTC